MLYRSLAAPLMAKAEEQGTQFPSVAENYIITLESPHNRSVSWALPETTGPAAQYQHPWAAFIIVLDIVTHPLALGTVQLMTPFVSFSLTINPVSGVESAGDSHCNIKHFPHFQNLILQGIRHLLKCR